MSVKRRVEKLEDQVPAVANGDPGEAPALIIAWDESELTDEQREQNRKARAWHKKHGRPEGGKVVVNREESLTWPDGSEVLDP